MSALLTFLSSALALISKGQPPVPKPAPKQGRTRPKRTPIGKLTLVGRKARYAGMKAAAEAGHKLARRVEAADGTIYGINRNGTLIRETPRRWEDKDRVGTHNNGVRRRLESMGEVA